MSKRLFLAFLLLMAITMSHAKDYYVHYVKGEVVEIRKHKTYPVKEKQYLSDKAKIIIKKGAGIVLVRDNEQSVPMIKGPAEGKVKKLINSEGCSIIDYGMEFITFIFGKSHGEAKAADVPDGLKATGSIYRKFKKNQSDETIEHLSKDECLELMDHFFEE